MNYNTDVFLFQLLKKAGIEMPTIEEAEMEIKAAEPLPLSGKVLSAVVDAMPADKQAEAANILCMKLATDTFSDKTSFTSVTPPSWFGKIQSVANGIGAHQARIAWRNLRKFLQLLFEDKDGLFAFLRQQVLIPATIQDQLFLKELLHQPDSLARVAAYYGQEDEVLATEARDWLRHESTSISSLVSTPHRRIFIAVVDEARVAPQKRFTAFWLQLSNECHVIAVSKRVPKKHELPKIICHELEEIYQTVTNSIVNNIEENNEMSSYDELMVAEEKTDFEEAFFEEVLDEEMADEGRKEIEEGSFAAKQRRRDSRKKEIVALWVSQHLPLGDGAGVVIDAGSACLKVWAIIVGLIMRHVYSFLRVFTNNFQVLQLWSKSYNSPGLRTTDVQLMGDRLDWEHLAFYGSEAVKKVMDPDFVATNVYIGASGIEFNQNRKAIRIVYHEPTEREHKVHLFKCRARRRIVLLTPHKIGRAGALGFNILDIDGIDTEAPIYLVTTKPEEGSEEEKEFKQVRRAFESKELDAAVKEKNLVLHWITVDCKKGEAPKMVDHFWLPSDVNGEIT